MNRRNSLVQFSCTVVVPYEWVWIVESYLLSSNLRSSHDVLDEGVRVPFFLPLVLNPRRSSKAWIELFASSVFVALLIPFLRFPSLLWRVDQRRVNPVFLPVFWLSC
jgi:hypothetical protein